MDLKPIERFLITSNKNKIKIYSENIDTIKHFNLQKSYADFIINQINTDKIYDLFLNNIENKNLTVLDIGANIGLFSLFIQDRSKVVYSLEPTPSHFKILKELTNEYSNITPIEVALNNFDNEIDFYLCENNTTKNSIKNIYDKKIIVKGIKLESLIKNLNLDHVDIVKCDIEGSEMIALTDELISPVKDIVYNWFIEVHATDDFSKQENRDIIKDILEKNNYNVIYYGIDTIHAFKK
jgi:FkbM family methyltransferase